MNSRSASHKLSYYSLSEDGHHLLDVLEQQQGLDSRWTKVTPNLATLGSNIRRNLQY